VGRLGAFFDDEAGQVRAVLSQIRAARATDAKSEVFVTQILQPLLQQGESLLVFTEYRATQDYLLETIAKAMPAVPCQMINGSLGLDEKTEAVRAFNAGEARVMISTEAGGEGLNLQEACHVMVNYDLPWNPSRLVQRIGRLYRYGHPRETLYTAFPARLSSLLATVLCGGLLTEGVPATGLLILRDGEPGELEVPLSPLRYHNLHRAEIEAVLQGAARDAAFDSVGAVITADGTISGLCERVEAEAPRPVDLPVEGRPV